MASISRKNQRLRKTGLKNRPFLDTLFWTQEKSDLDQKKCQAVWDLAKKLKVSGSDLAFGGRFREVLQNKTTLTTALGRPNREQVSTVRPSVATTLQALTLTNGEVLSKLIKEGAVTLSNDEAKKQLLASRIFQFALGRKPSNSEVLMIKELVEGENAVNSFEDVLWALIMLPEFQLIY